MKTFSAFEVDDGKMIAQLDEEIRRLCEDVLDLNKKPTQTRTITLTLKAIPAKSRREAELKYNVVLKPANHDDRETTTVWLDRDREGEVVASVRRIDQPMLPGADDSASSTDKPAS